MRFRTLAGFALLGGSTTALGAQTTTMDFSTLQPYSNYAPLPQSYGDHANLDVTSTTRTGFGNQAVSCNYVDLWGTGYSALNAAAFACYNGGVGELYFQPGAGKTVTLSQLYLGSYASINGVGPSRAMQVTIFDAAWNTLFNFSGNITANQVLTPYVSSSSGLYLQWGTDWNTGVDLIETTVGDIPVVPPTTTAPEPASFVLVASGLGIVALMRRRRIA